jgi:hypothetical protein
MPAERTTLPATNLFNAALPPERRAGLDPRAVAWLERLLTRGEHVSSGTPLRSEPATETKQGN